MNIILFDDSSRGQLLPLTFTRPVAEIRIGMLSLKEKWHYYFPSAKISYLTESFLQEKFPIQQDPQTIWINASVLPNVECKNAILSLKQGEAVLDDSKILLKNAESLSTETIDTQVNFSYDYLNALPQIFSWNDKECRKDFELLTLGKKSLPLNASNTLIGSPDQLFIEEGAIVNASILNTSSGPIYIAKDAEVMEGCMIRGPFFWENIRKLKWVQKFTELPALDNIAK